MTHATIEVAPFLRKGCGMTGLLNPNSSEKLRHLILHDESRRVPSPWDFASGNLADLFFSKSGFGRGMP